MKSLYYVAAVAALVVGLSTQVLASPKPPVPLNTDVITTEALIGGPTLEFMTLLSTGWEAPFVLGPMEPQQGWTASGVNLPYASISAANPHSGTQHLRIVNDPTVGAGTLRVMLSPVVAVPANSPSTTTEWIYISNDGGADIDAIGQAPSQGFISYRVKFSFSDDTGAGPGTIYVLDNVGGLFFINTGVTWNTAVYTQLKVQFDPALGEIRYFYDGNLIYTGVIVAGTSIEQVGYLADNFQLAGEHAGVDDVSLIDTATDPTASKTSSWGKIKSTYR
jgi:hypothetical protein